MHRLRGAAPGGAQGPIGLELGRDRIHLAQLERDAGGAVRFRAQASLPYSGTREDLLSSHQLFKPLVKRALGSAPFRGRRVVTCLPPSDTRIMSITYDASGARDDGAAVLQVMRSRLNGALEDYVIDFLPVRPKSKDEQRLAVVAVARREKVVRLLELFRRSGLEVEALEIGPAAIKRLVSALSMNRKPENVLIVNCGHSHSYLTMLSGRRLLLDQQLAFGEQQLIDRLCTELEMSEEAVRVAVHRVGIDAKFDPDLTELSNTGLETSQVILDVLKPKLLAFADEIKRALRYVTYETRGEPVHRLYLMGGFANWRGSDRVLRRLVDIPVEKLPSPQEIFPAVSGNSGHSLRNGNSDLVIATGLALRGIVTNE
ncbi:MAG TPA: pilus assembly protein PilM [Gammaproteobacteria bacterium]|nr:pilus assembly protein PilM [Gammaproteobacteria bacterium]